MIWKIRLLQAAEKELIASPADIRARFLHISDLIIEFGPQQVGMPHVRPLEGKLWEIRMTGRDGIARAIYVVCRGQELLVLHIFRKKTQRTPRKAIEIATERLQRIKNE